MKEKALNPGSVWFRLVSARLVRFGSVRFGFAWFGLMHVFNITTVVLTSDDREIHMILGRGLIRVFSIASVVLTSDDREIHMILG